jgi:hypothetical protein
MRQAWARKQKVLNYISQREGILEKTKFGLMRTNVVAVDTTCHWASSLKFMATMVIVVVFRVINIIIPAGPNIFFFSKLPAGSGAHPASYATQIVLLSWGKMAEAWP